MYAVLGIVTLVLLPVIFGGIGYAVYLFFAKKDKKKAIKSALIGVVSFAFLGLLYYAGAREEKIFIEELTASLEQHQEEEVQRRLEEELQKREEEQRQKEEQEWQQQLLKQQEEERKRQQMTDEEKIAEVDWRTDLTWDNLMRNPEEHVVEYIQFSGEIQTVQADDSKTIYQIMMNGDVDQPIIAEIETKNLEQRILEDDQVTVYGMFSTLIEYSTVMGGTKQAPYVLIEVIQLNQ